MSSNFRDLRQRARIKQKTVCALLGLDTGFYCRVESGVLKPSPDRERQIRCLLERLAGLRAQFWFADLDDLKVARSLLDANEGNLDSEDGAHVGQIRNSTKFTQTKV